MGHDPRYTGLPCYGQLNGWAVRSRPVDEAVTASRTAYQWVADALALSAGSAAAGHSSSRQETNAFRTAAADHFALPCGLRTP